LQRAALCLTAQIVRDGAPKHTAPFGAPHAFHLRCSSPRRAFAGMSGRNLLWIRTSPVAPVMPLLRHSIKYMGRESSTKRFSEMTMFKMPAFDPVSDRRDGLWHSVAGGLGLSPLRNLGRYNARAGPVAPAPGGGCLQRHQAARSSWAPRRKSRRPIERLRRPQRLGSPSFGRCALRTPPGNGWACGRQSSVKP